MAVSISLRQARIFKILKGHRTESSHLLAHSLSIRYYRIHSRTRSSRIHRNRRLRRFRRKYRPYPPIYLSTLEDLEYLVNENGSYQLSLKFLDHGTLVRNETPFVEVTKNYLKETLEETGEIAWLSTEEHGQAVYLDTAKGSNGVDARGRVGSGPTSTVSPPAKSS